ncbi:hypothetical protein NKJ22_30680 [Mesorhizobium sp. M0220]
MFRFAENSGGGLECVHQPGIGGGDAGHRIGAFRGSLDLECTTAGRQGEQQELAIAAIADACGGNVLGFALVLDAHLEQERAADRLKGAADNFNEFLFGNSFGVGQQIGRRDIGRYQIGQTFSKRIFEGFVIQLRVHANLFQSPIAPRLLINVNAEHGRIVANFASFGSMHRSSPVLAGQSAGSSHNGAKK